MNKLLPLLRDIVSLLYHFLFHDLAFLEVRNRLAIFQRPLAFPFLRFPPLFFQFTSPNSIAEVISFGRILDLNKSDRISYILKVNGWTGGVTCDGTT